VLERVKHHRTTKRRTNVTHMPPESKSVLIVCDRIFEAIGLASLLTEAGGFTVLEPATDLTTAERMTVAHQPDIAVVLNHSQAPSVQRVLESSTGPTPSIVIVAEPGSGCGVESTHSLLLIPPDPDVLIPALRMMSAGYLVFRTQDGGTGAEPMNKTLHTLARRLTWREFEVFSLVARGCTNTEIGNLLGITERTVKGHVSRILEKLALSGRTDMVVKAYAPTAPGSPAVSRTELAGLHLAQHGPLIDSRAFRHRDAPDHSGPVRGDGLLHLHRLDDEQHVPGLHDVAF